MEPSDREYFDRHAPEYDDWWLGSGRFAAQDRPGWDDEVAQLVEVVGSLPPCRTLDVACGTGYLTRHLRGPVTALDQSEPMLAIARERLPEAEIVSAGVPPLPFADGAFERVFTSHFYHHLPEPIAAEFLAEARRVAGELVVVERGAYGPSLAGELGGGEVLLAGRWFVVVRS